MKNALKLKRVLIGTIILCALILVFFLVNVVLEYGFLIALPYKLIYFLTFILVFLLFIAFVSGDIRANRYRHKNKLWAGPLPPEIKQSVWNIRTPWLIASALTIVQAIIYSIIWSIH